MLPRADINITPLIDILLVLLVIYSLRHETTFLKCSPGWSSEPIRDCIKDVVCGFGQLHESLRN